MNRMKEIRVDAIDKIIESLITGMHNTLSLAEMCEYEDGGSDIVNEARVDAKLMQSQINQLKTWRK